jgi:mannose-6-phosphate isomerase-like protein (cupin superfamily)
MKMINIHELAEEGVSHNTKIRKRQILEHGIVNRITNYARAVFPPGEKAGAHRHEDMAEVFTVESGCGEIRINEAVFTFSEGLTVVVEPGEMHEIINTGSAELVVTYFGVLAE